MNNETTQQTRDIKNSIPKMNVLPEAKVVYEEGENFDPNGITFFIDEIEETLTITAEHLMQQGRVYPTTNLSKHVTDICFNVRGYDIYLPIIVLSKNGEESVPATKTLPLTNSVTATWFPATGEMATSFTDAVFDRTPFNFELKHVHINKEGTFATEPKWKLNLHRVVKSATEDVLEKLEMDSLQEYDYIYIDEYGKVYPFKENYYYINENKEKVLCDRMQVSIDSLGVLTCTIEDSQNTPTTYYAKREFVSPTGLKLEGEFKGIKGVELIEQRHEDVAALEEKIEQINSAISETNDAILEIQDELDNNENLNNDEKSKYTSQQAKLSKNIQTYQNLLTKSTEQLENLKLQVPVVYLVDSNETAMCFNHLGNLCAIVDSYGNFVLVEWGFMFDGTTKKAVITGLYEGDFYTKFNYNDNKQLSSIITANGEEISYFYTEAKGNLEKVTYSNGKILNFAYINKDSAEKYVARVVESNGQCAQITYESYKPSVITYSSCTGTVANGSTLEKEYQVTDEILLSNKTGLEMPYVSLNGLKTVIIVDSTGSQIGDYTTSGKNIYDKSLSYSFYDKDSEAGFSVKEDVAEAILFENETICSQTTSELKHVSTIEVSSLKPNCREFVFTANSRTTDGIMEPYVPQFKLSQCQLRNALEKNYRLVAKLYKQNNVLENTYYVSINYRNAFVQTTALPISLSSDTEKIELYVQYDNLPYTAYFYNMRLTPCSSEYYTYDDFGNVVKTISSKKAIGFDENNQAQYAHTETNNTYNVLGKLSKAEQMLFINDQEMQTTVCEYQYCNHGNIVREESYIEGKQATYGVNVIERVCDENGNVVKEILYNSLDSSSKFYTESNFDETGKVLCQVDETGENKTTLVYKDGTTQVQAQALPNGSTFAYGTDKSGNVTSITHSTSLGEENSTNTNYTHGLPTKVTSGNNVVDYTYDYKGRVTKVVVNGEETTCSYTENITFENISCDKTTIHSRGVNSSAYIDKQGKVLCTTLNTNLIKSQYDQFGRLTKRGNIEYSYDSLNRLGQVKKDGVTTETYTYDKFGRTSGKTIGEQTYIYTYVPEDEPSGKLQSLTLPNGAVMKPLTDVNGRNKGKEVLVSGNKVMAEHISYRKVGDHATNQPSAIYFGDKANGEFAIKSNLKYKYDEMGNVTHIFQDGILVVAYVYDKLGRLIREDNKKLGKTYLYSYDNCGNMLSRRIANYTTKPAEEITFTQEFLYSHIGDRLVSVNGQALSYDNYGRLLNYNNKALSWQSNRLASVDDVAITYDVFGRRTSKGETTFTYDSSNNLLTAGSLSFLYDTYGIAGFVCDGATYFYRKNIQGDVIAILNANGVIVATYNYDAWGNCVVTTDTNGIGEINPIRYRSYYWDSEFGLYYLQSRYYSPELCRFISQDSIDYLDPKSINGLNLYAYCLNNPVVLVDFNGHSWQSFWTNIGNWFVNTENWINNNIIQPVGAFFKENWDIIVGVTLIVASIAISIAISIATFGAGTVLVGAAIAGVIGAGFGALGAYTRGENVLWGMLNGFVTGFTGTISPLAGALSAAGMTFIVSRANGLSPNWKTVGSAAINGILALGFSAGSNWFGKQIIKGSKDILLEGATSFTTSVIFDSWSFVADKINSMFWG